MAFIGRNVENSRGSKIGAVSTTIASFEILVKQHLKIFNRKIRNLTPKDEMFE